MVGLLLLFVRGFCDIFGVVSIYRRLASLLSFGLRTTDDGRRNTKMKEFAWWLSRSFDQAFILFSMRASRLESSGLRSFLLEKMPWHHPNTSSSTNRIDANGCLPTSHRRLALADRFIWLSTIGDGHQSRV